MEDKELIHKIQRGQKDLLNTVIEKYYPDICRYCACLTGNREEAYDLTQDTFLKFIQNVDFYRYRNLKAYLFMIARNNCMDYFRRQKRECAAEFQEDGTGDDDRRLEQAETQSWLSEELRKLPSEQREALVLYYYGDMKLKDIARITGANLSTVKSRIRQGTGRLKRQCGI